MELAARAAGIADPEGDPTDTEDPNRDLEANPVPYYPANNLSRSSLPNRTRSFSTVASRRRRRRAASVATTTDGAQAEGHDQAQSQSQPQGQEQGDQTFYADEEDDYGDDEDDDDGNIWGPSHPCFPHANPHVPRTSPLFVSTRIIRVRRDWMVAGDLAPAFAQLYPEILEPVLAEAEFRRIVAHVNTALVRAFDPWRPRAWLDAAAAAASGWLWDDLGLTGAKRELRALEAWLERWNAEVGMADGVSVVALRRTAFLCLDFQIPDPQIAVGGVPPPSRARDGDSQMAKASIPLSAYSASVRPSRTASITTAGSVSTRGAGGKVAGVAEPEYGAYPVPKIPARYLGEAQKAGD